LWQQEPWAQLGQFQGFNPLKHKSGSQSALKSQKYAVTAGIAH
jgi:hypothetical protein